MYNAIKLKYMSLVTMCSQQKSITMILVHSCLGKIWAFYSQPNTVAISYQFAQLYNFYTALGMQKGQ